MGSTSRSALRGLGLAAFAGLAYLIYLRFYLVHFRNTRDFHAATEIHSTAQVTMEDFELLRRHKHLVVEFEKRMYTRVANGDLPLKGKTAVITGATKGIGRATAAHLAAFGASLILPCRRCNFDEFKKQIQDDAQLVFGMYKPASSKKAKLDHVAVPQVFDVDLADLDQIDAFVEWYKKNGFPSADILVNNAGLVSPYLTMTKNGFESTFGVNFLASAYLTDLLLKNNLVKGRIVSVSSEDHRAGPPIEEVLQRENKKFGQPWGTGLLDAMTRYDYSKLVQSTYFLGLAKRTHLTVIDMCPGPVASDISLNAKWPIGPIAKFFIDLLFPTIYEGGMLVARFAVDEQFANSSGKHFQLMVETPARDDATDDRMQTLVHEWSQQLFTGRRPPQ